MNEPGEDPIDSIIKLISSNNTGLASINGNFTIADSKLTINLPSFVGYIYDVDTEISTKVKFDGVANYTPEFLLTDPNTYILVDINKNIVATNVTPTVDEELAYIYLCNVYHPSGQVLTVTPAYTFISEDSTVLLDIINFLEPTIKGCTIIGNGTNLKLSRYEGAIILKNITSNSLTNLIKISAANNFAFNRVTIDGISANAVTDLDPANYDANGTLTAVASNLYTIQRIGVSFDRNFTVQYGCQTFASVAAAAAIFDNINVLFPKELSLKSGAILAYAIVKGNATSLAQTDIYPTNNFGELVKSTPVSTVVSTTGALLTTNNLSDVANVSSARTNLGAGSAGGLATLDTNTYVPVAQLYRTLRSYQIPTFMLNTTIYSSIFSTTLQVASIQPTIMLNASVRIDGISTVSMGYVIWDASTGIDVQLYEGTTNLVDGILSLNLGTNITFSSQIYTLLIQVKKINSANPTPYFYGATITIQFA